MMGQTPKLIAPKHLQYNNRSLHTVHRYETMSITSLKGIMHMCRGGQRSIAYTISNYPPASSTPPSEPRSIESADQASPPPRRYPASTAPPSSPPPSCPTKENQFPTCLPLRTKSTRDKEFVDSAMEKIRGAKIVLSPLRKGGPQQKNQTRERRAGARYSDPEKRRTGVD